MKLNEVSYIHAEGMPAAEMKDGPIALIDEGMPVVVAPKDHTYDKVIANIEEVRGRQGRVIGVATEGDQDLKRLDDEVVYVPATLPIMSPLLTTIPLQLLAYHIAKLRGTDIDQGQQSGAGNPGYRTNHKKTDEVFFGLLPHELDEADGFYSIVVRGARSRVFASSRNGHVGERPVLQGLLQSGNDF